MHNFNIKETNENPSIEFLFSEGTLLIKGKSISNNPMEFYTPLLDCLSEYQKNPLTHTKAEFKLEYFNTTSSKCILEILKKLKKISSPKNKLTIDWIYDDDDDEILEVGEDFSSIINHPFNFKSISVSN